MLNMVFRLNSRFNEFSCVTYKWVSSIDETNISIVVFHSRCCSILEHVFCDFTSSWFAVCQKPSRPQELSSQGHILEVAIEAATTAVINLRDSLNEWDSTVGDGDCGSTVSVYITHICPSNFLGFSIYITLRPDFL